MGCSHDCDNKTEFGFCRTTACTNPKYNGSGTYIIGKPMEQRNEPSTAEIVNGLRRLADDFHIDFGGLAWAIGDAADRLEQLERENAELKSSAEKAEAERDAAVAWLRAFDWCAGCKNMKHRQCKLMEKCGKEKDLYDLCVDRGTVEDEEV